MDECWKLTKWVNCRFLGAGFLHKAQHMAVERRRYMLAKNNLEYRLKCYKKETEIQGWLVKMQAIECTQWSYI
jgi:hypothetical protein